MQTTTTQTNQAIHANISTELKQSVRDWCNRNDLTEAQLIRRAIQAILRLQP
jgi:hypothetical protein